ncbi:transposase IS4 family protein [Alicyclobacillus hesperidum URH17-3-68]|nr:transposase IS4 family protein [Alicyclobacillus hesperidum URH17-3-68]
MQAMHRVTKSTVEGIVVQRTETTEAQREILRALRIKEPPRILKVEPRARGL